MTFAVNGNLWKLSFVPIYSQNLRRSDGSYTLGVTDGNLNTVFIADNLSDEMTDKVLVHELSHVHAMECGYSVDIQTEEIICDFLSLYGRGIIYLADSILSNLMTNIA